MLDTKYALKYHMPHSLLHIVDNSMYTGDIVPSVADDPSLYSTIVVSGAPMGEDNKIITLTRTDVAAAAYGLNSLSTDDVKRFGQAVEYPMSLLSRGSAPVRFMRVTPEGATYAFVTLLIQWKIDTDESGAEVMKVRFVTNNDLPVGLRLDRFKNTERLNATIINNTSKMTVDDEWNQRVLINAISAGRGSIYNNMSFSITLAQQNKRPANCKYVFTTYDTYLGATVETFTASLINTTTNRTDAIDSANVTVRKRVEGSSIVIPYINEGAIQEVYEDYKAMLKRNIDAGYIGTNLNEIVQNQMYAMLNVNIFDILYGNYIYTTDADYKLPFYQVEMFTSDIEALPKANRLVTTSAEFTDTSYPEPVYNVLNELSYGLYNADDSIHVGDIYLSGIGSSNIAPTLSMIAAINQYSGSVTTVSFDKIKLINPIVPNATEFAAISGYITDDPNGGTLITDPIDPTAILEGLANSAQLKYLVNKGYITKYTTNASGEKEEVRSLIAYVVGDTFYLYEITYLNSDTNEYSDTPTAVDYYTMSNLYELCCDWETATTIRNIIAHDTTDSAYKKVGYLYINKTTDTTATPMIIDYEPIIESGVITDYEHRELTNTRLKFGTVPTEVNITTDMIGTAYDILEYNTGDILSARILGVTIAAGGEGYIVGDVIKCASLGNDVEFSVTAVDNDGEVTGLIITKSVVTYNDDITYQAISEAETTDTTEGSIGTGLTISIGYDNLEILSTKNNTDPIQIIRYIVSGTTGSLFRVNADPTVIPNDYYTEQYGVNPSAEYGGIKLDRGYTGFFDDPTISSIEYKWRYQALLVKAFKGEIDPRIKSVSRCPAKFLFDGGTNTILGMTLIPTVAYAPIDIINASTIFTDDEKDAIIYDPTIVTDHIVDYEDIDVKQAMYDLMVYRCYQGIPEDRRPEGPGYGLQLYLDSGEVDITTAQLMNNSFSKRFTNPNATWDIGGYTDADNGITYTYTKWIVDNMFAYLKSTTFNKPFAMNASAIPSYKYTSFYPDIDASDWDLRELMYNSGGNAWILDINGNIVRFSQRTLQTSEETSDLVQESNMRTLSQFCYLLQNKIDSRLLDYSEDGTLRTLKDECDNMFSNWSGNLVESYNLEFTRDTNPTDGGDIVVCDAELTFRGLILRTAIIVNVQRRASTT